MDISLGGRRHIPVLAVVAAMVVVASATAWFFLRPGGGITSAPPSRGLDQARWKITTRAVGVARATAKEKALVRRRKPAVAALVKDVYDALLLDRDARRKAIRRYFTASAGKAFFARGVDIAKRAAVETRRRRADIGIDAHSATRAAASVTVVATVGDGKRRERVMHRASLYLEKQRRGWQVIAFAVDQRGAGNARAAKGRDGDGGGDKRGGKENRRDRSKNRTRGRRDR